MKLIYRAFFTMILLAGCAQKERSAEELYLRNAVELSSAILSSED